MTSPTSISASDTFPFSVEVIAVSEEKNKVDEIYEYGQANKPHETAELVSTSLKKLDEIVEMMPIAKKKAWTMALDKCPALCGECHKLMFLRSDLFDCVAATERLTKYWTMRLELFGVAKAFLPLTLGDDGALKDDKECLEIGVIRVINQTDGGGRGILFLDPSLQKPDSYQQASLIRSTWYCIHAVLEDENIQKNGIILLVDLLNARLSQFDRKLSTSMMGCLKGCLPLRVAAFHLCHAPTFFGYVFPIIKLLMGSRLRTRVKMNYGSNENVLKIMKEYGIHAHCIPNELGGDLVLDHESWLKERMSRGL